MDIFGLRIERSEKRAAGNYTSSLVDQIVARATGTSAADASATAALEVAAGVWSRAMAAATVTPATAGTAAITPAVMALAGRQAIRCGASLFVISVDAGNVRLIPAWSWETLGGPDPAEWLYRVTLSGPSSTVTRTVPAAGIVHLPFAVDVDAPWRGLGPMAFARSTAALAGNLEARLSQEAGAPVGSVIPVPGDGGSGDDADPLKDLKADLRASRGGVSLIETVASGWGEGKGAAPQSDWTPRRYGADPPEPLRGLRADVFDSVCMAAGLPPGMSARSDGTLAREGLRQLVMLHVEPLARVWAAEFAVKLDAPGLAFNFRSIWAHDLAGRAGALQKMTAAGMPLADAVAASGVLAEDS